MNIEMMAAGICKTVDRLFGDWKPENLEAGTFVRKRQFTVATLLKLWSFSAFDGGRLGDDAVIGEVWRRDLFSLGQRQPAGIRWICGGVHGSAGGHGTAGGT